MDGVGLGLKQEILDDNTWITTQGRVFWISHSTVALQWNLESLEKLSNRRTTTQPHPIRFSIVQQDVVLLLGHASQGVIPFASQLGRFANNQLLALYPNFHLCIQTALL